MNFAGGGGGKAHPRLAKINHHVAGLNSGNPRRVKAAKAGLKRMNLTYAEQEHVHAHMLGASKGGVPGSNPAKAAEHHGGGFGHLVGGIAHGVAHEVVDAASGNPFGSKTLETIGSGHVPGMSAAKADLEKGTGYREIRHIRQHPIAGSVALAGILPVGRLGRAAELGIDAARGTKAVEQAAKYLPKGLRRTTEQVDQHIAEVAADAKARGHGIKGEEIPVLERGQTTPETGGHLGLEVRHALQGIVPDIAKPILQPTTDHYFNQAGDFLPKHLAEDARTAVHNIHDRHGNIIGSLVYDARPARKSVYVESVFIRPEFRSIENFQKLLAPLRAEKRPITADIENPRLKRVFERAVKSGAIKGKILPPATGRVINRGDIPPDLPPLIRNEAMGPYEHIGAQLDQPGVAVARKAQEAGYSAERSQRIAAARAAYERAGGGTAGHIAAKAELKGELPKVGIQGLQHLDRPAIDALTRHIWEFPHLQDFSKISAVDAIEKLAAGGSVTESEQKLLQKVFGVEMKPQALKASIRQMGFKNFVFNLLNLPRAIMTSFDLSYRFRQGFVAFASHPKLMSRNVGAMIKSFGSEQVAQAAQKAIEEMPTFPIMEDAGLHVTSWNAGPASREEPYMYSQVAEHLPGIGHIIKGSDRSYVIAGNMDRAAYADYMMRNLAAEGWDLRDPHLIKSIAKFANTATGRGTLPRVVEKHALTLNATFFAPRFMASRFNMLSPIYYMSLHPAVRKEALKSMSRITGMVIASLYMARLAGAHVVIDPRNSDFGKARFGNMRVDFTGGYGASVRFIAQLMTDTAISSTSGRKENLPNHQGDILWRFFSGKFNPPVSTTIQAVQRKDAIGNPLNFKSPNPSKNFIMSRFTPMIAQDAAEVALDNPKKLGVIVPDIFGASVQDYGPPKKKGKGRRRSGPISNPYSPSGGTSGGSYAPSSSGGSDPYAP